MSRANLAVLGAVLMAGIWCQTAFPAEPHGGAQPAAGQHDPNPPHGGHQSAPETPVPELPAAGVEIVVDSAVQHQVMEGFGATTDAVSRGGDDKMGQMRAKVLEAAYGQVKLTMGEIHCGPYEGHWDKPVLDGLPPTANDNDDPNVFDWTGFHWERSDDAKTRLVDIAGPLGFDNFSLRGAISPKWGDRWLLDIRKKDRNRYLQECAENAAAILVRWRDQYKIVPRWHQLFNEPTSGNGEVEGANEREIIDLVKACGARFRKEGFKDIRMLVPCEETVGHSLHMAKAILEDPEARQYVGAIGYHAYPYGSAYCEIRKILAGPGAGRPEAREIKVRNDLRDLARKHGVQAWMNEISHGNADRFDTLLGRAIHIHDELLYADASAFWGMFVFTNLRPTGRRHGGDPFKDEDGMVAFDPKEQTFHILGMGYAVGHYARWIKRGAVRIEATSSHPLVQVTAFRDDGQKTAVLVLINNAAAAAKVKISLKGFANREPLRFEGEQSTRQAFWAKLAPAVSETPASLVLELPARSVTSLSARL